MLLNCGVGEDSWESLGLQGDQTSQSYRKSTLTIHRKDLYWSWSSNTLATWCEEPTCWKRPWHWERWEAKEEEDARRGDGWMASLNQWKWVWASSRRWWRTEGSGVLQSMGSQIAGHDWGSQQQQYKPGSTVKESNFRTCWCAKTVNLEYIQDVYKTGSSAVQSKIIMGCCYEEIEY